MAELADAQDLGSCAARCAGSTPVTRTMIVADVIVRGDFNNRNRFYNLFPSIKIHEGALID